MSVQFPDLGIFPVYECFAAVLRRGAYGANRKFKPPRYQAEPPMEIRTAVTADEAQWRGLWRGCTEFYEMHPPENVTADTWRRIVAPQPAIPCRFAEQEGRLPGFSHSPPHKGTFR